jgi:hypothetical protein
MTHVTLIDAIVTRLKRDLTNIRKITAETDDIGTFLAEGDIKTVPCIVVIFDGEVRQPSDGPNHESMPKVVVCVIAKSTRGTQAASEAADNIKIDVDNSIINATFGLDMHPLRPLGTRPPHRLRDMVMYPMEFTTSYYSTYEWGNV